MLCAMGYRTQVIGSSSTTPECDVLVALHARRSAEVVAAFRKKFPERPVIVVLSGTDVYGPRGLTGRALKTLQAADAIVTLQSLAIRRMPAALRKKAIAIVQSAERVTKDARRKLKPNARVRFCVLGHLRAVKDPLRAAFALRHVASDDVEVLQAGGILDAKYAARVKAIAAREPRYTYLGEMSGARSQRLLARCDALVLSSRSEGGANVASEAIANGIPVIASRIEGNVGVLGARYGGYYATGSSEALAALMERFATEPTFADLLRRQIRALQPIVRPDREARCLAAALALAIRNNRGRSLVLRNRG